MNNENSQNNLYMESLTYEEYMSLRREIIARHRENTVQRLKDNFPIKYVLLFSSCLILIGITEIILQIVLMVNKGPLNYVGHGIWGGMISILLGLVGILFCNFLNAQFFLKLK